MILIPYSMFTNTSAHTKPSQCMTMPLNRPRVANTNNNFKTMRETPNKQQQHQQHDSEVDSVSSLLSSLSSTTSSLSIKGGFKKSSSSSESSSSSSTSSSYENEPALASVSDKIKKLSGETAQTVRAFHQDTASMTTKRGVSTYSSCSSLVAKTNKTSEADTQANGGGGGGAYSSNSLTSASALNSNSSSPSCSSPTSNRTNQVGFVLFFFKVY